MRRLSQEHIDTLPSSGTELEADHLPIANLRSYPLSCTVAIRDGSFKCKTQWRVMPSVGIELATLQLLFRAPTD